jgi:hypothetical protein
MSQGESSELVSQRLRTMQIVAAALIAAPLFLFVVALLVRAQGVGAQPAVPIVSYVGIAFALVEVLVFMIFPNRAAAAACRKGPLQAAADSQDLFLCGVFQTRLVIGFALLEGAAFLQGIAYILEGQSFSLAIGLTLVLIMAFLLPTRSKLESWMEEQKQVMLDQQSLGS